MKESAFLDAMGRYFAADNAGVRHIGSATKALSESQLALYPTTHSMIPGTCGFIRPPATDQSVDSNFVHFGQ
jgi:hypothetical protein